MRSTVPTITLKSLKGGFAKGVSFGAAVKTLHLHKMYVESVMSSFSLSISEGGIHKAYLPLMVSVLDDLSFDWDDKFSHVREIYFYRSPRNLRNLKYLDEIWDERGYAVMTLLLFKKKMYYPPDFFKESWCSYFFSLSET